MSHFLRNLVRSEDKSCSRKIKFPREDSAMNSAADMMRKKGNGEVFEHYRCEFCDGWHIGHRTNFDWIPVSHSSYSLLIIHYRCKPCSESDDLCTFWTNTCISNRILDHFPAIADLPESCVRCPYCKKTEFIECCRVLVPLSEIDANSEESVPSLWDRYFNKNLTGTPNLDTLKVEMTT